MDYSLRGLRPKYLQRKAQEQLMAYSNVTWNDFSTHTFQEDVMLQVSSDFLSDGEQIRTQLSALGQEIRNSQSELQEHRVNAGEENFRPWAPTQKWKQTN